VQLSAVRVFVQDLAAAEHFYGALLGLPLQAGGAAHGFCVYGVGGPQLVVEPVPGDAPAEDQALVGRFTGVSFAVASAHAAHAQLSQRGVVFLDEPQRQPWGGILATFRDPAGNALQLVEAPGAASP
jgi:catechol 2,3-dioxygenase-like lactoylglutathione lyase family enzyme